MRNSQWNTIVEIHKRYNLIRSKDVVKSRRWYPNCVYVSQSLTCAEVLPRRTTERDIISSSFSTRPTIRKKVKVPKPIPSLSRIDCCVLSSQFTSKFIISSVPSTTACTQVMKSPRKISTPNKHFQYATHRCLGCRWGIWGRSRHCLPSAMHQLIN